MKKPLKRENGKPPERCLMKSLTSTQEKTPIFLATSDRLKKISPAWELPESFEAWAERIVDPKRNNLDFVALS